MLRKLRSREEMLGRFARFVMVGGMTAATQFGVLYVLAKTSSPVIAFSLAYLCAISVHYSCNRFWALPSSRKDTWKQLAEYLATGLVSYGLNVAVFAFALRLGLGVMVAAVAAAIPVMFIVFAVLNFRVFARNHRKGDHGDE